MTNPLVNFIVLGLAFLFEGTSWVITLREFARTTGKLGWWQAMRASKDPSTLVVLCEASAALLGLAFATAALSSALFPGGLRLDGARPDELRAGIEWFSTGRSRWLPNQLNK